ncbi:hypothetical protein STEG23_016805 [Scotinomys teguina]
MEAGAVFKVRQEQLSTIISLGFVTTGSHVSQLRRSKWIKDLNIVNPDSLNLIEEKDSLSPEERDLMGTYY